MNYFSQLLSVQNVSVKQVEIHTAEPLLLDSCHLEVGIGIAELKNNKSPDSDQIPTELFLAEGETLVSTFHGLINSIWSKEELPISGKGLLL
jgi:hypothetical protein